ncbi:MAG: tetratricopeptide repeat protein [Marmoricola sp.]|nr:tetratricopeptide repeat protein [Marmoricola sp.]
MWLAAGFPALWRNLDGTRWRPSAFGKWSVVPSNSMIALVMTRGAEIKRINQLKQTDPKTKMPPALEQVPGPELKALAGAKGQPFWPTFKKRRDQVSEALKRTNTEGTKRLVDSLLDDLCVGLDLGTIEAGADGTDAAEWRQRIIAAGRRSPENLRQVDGAAVADRADRLIGHLARRTREKEEQRRPGNPVLDARGRISGDPVPPRPSAFVVRESVLEKVEQAAAGGSTVVFTQQVLTGDGGVGKTQLAAYEFDRSDADLKVWINATSRDNLLAGYGRVHDDIYGLGAADLPVEAKARRLLNDLRAIKPEHDFTWLIVLDDLPDLNTIDRDGDGTARHLWPLGERGRTIVTSNWRQGMTAGGRTVIEVGVYEPEDAFQYLSDRLQPLIARDELPTDTLDEALDLAHDLGYHPAALAQAAALIDMDMLTCAQFRTHYADRTRTLDQLFPQRADHDAYGRSIATLWNITQDTLVGTSDTASRAERAGTRSPHAIRLATFLAHLDPNGIPDQLTATSRAINYITQNEDSDWDTDLKPALLALHALSVITWTPGNHTIRIHGLTQRAIQEAHPNDRESAGRAARSGLTEAFDGLEEMSAAEAGELPEQIVRNALHHNRLLRPDDPARTEVFVTAAAKWLQEHGRLQEALWIQKQVLHDLTKTAGPDHPFTMTARQNVAQIRAFAGEVDGAITEYETLVKQQTKVLGPDHPDVLLSRHNLAYLQGEVGDASASLAAFAKLLAHLVSLFGPDDPRALSVRHCMAFVRAKLGEVDAAIADLEDLLGHRRRVLGDDDRDTLVTRHGIAYFQGETGRGDLALPAMEQVLADETRVLGSDHPLTLTSRHNVVALRAQQTGDIDAGISDFKEVLLDSTRILGPDHPSVLAHRFSVAYAESQAGNAGDALVALRLLLADRVRILGPDHPDTRLTSDLITRLQSD